MVETSQNPEADDASSENLLPDLVEKDIGARNPTGWGRRVVIFVAIIWSLFQLWIASPFQYQFDFLAINNTEARAIHLAFALFLTFLVCPAFYRSPRDSIPFWDWLLAIVASFCAAYIFMEYDALALRPGRPLLVDILVSIGGIVFLLEAARRSLGAPLMVIASVFLFYTFAGGWEYMPDLIAHRGQSLEKVASHQWLSSEGVFGIALGVSTSFVFLFVLFGALLEKAGAGNYFIQVAFALLGHMRGGPAKAAVLSSGLTGLVSGSSIANVVMTGTFTIPLMRRVGFSREKAGAVEVSSSVNGQIMPPVMGTAAFLMVEYIGIPYWEVVRHAFLPAVISYIALLYIVHLEALKQDMPALPRRHERRMFQSLVVYGITICSIIILSGLVYYGVGWIKEVYPENALAILVTGLVAAYLGLLYYASRFPDLKQDDPKAPIFELPELGATAKTGLHYILPLCVLIWCLMIERLSPGLSAFWACFVLIVMVLTQRPLLALFRGNWKKLPHQMLLAVWELIDGLQIGARNMVAIAVATAAAGIIVGTVTLTSLPQVMTEIVEVLSGGSFILVLIYTAIICVILGMGLPTTANYIVVASIMVSVIQDLGAQHGFYIPTIAIHLFVFYFGIMADVTPPVGLASFAAAAVSTGDPIRTGLQAFLYSSRTVILPFFFIFNHELLLIGVDSFSEGLWVFLLYTSAILIFSAAVQGYFIARSTWFESVALLVIASMLFIPNRWLALVYPEFEEVAPTQLEQVVGSLEDGETLHLQVAQEDLLGDVKTTYFHIHLEGETTKERLKFLGLKTKQQGEETLISQARFGGAAQKAGLAFGNKIVHLRKPLLQPDYKVVYGVAFSFLALVMLAQAWRVRKLRDTPKKRSKILIND